jgi:Tfp pilus assembly protein PilV
VRRRGLTLVEVLVAVVVCGAGIAVVATGISACVRAEGYAGNLVRAADHAQLVLARVESGILPIQSAAGDFTDEGYTDLFWELEVDNTEVEGLQVLTVTIVWVSQGVEREFTVERQLFVDPLLGGIR